ncbi:hypothetical protein GGQ74_001084 [Desulfobaculum xiamenense]|uniref:Uncharacterized protein n=1 Tax=Desulfobaculum xiamenense TaxID=995050 RepID=A0A846QQF7_9BACT|nr:hypothetical protein [Desulfobaculum xiamenense]NJB67444.1 hypothetical protein [Desulfobaculum xiamenense]
MSEEQVRQENGECGKSHSEVLDLFGEYMRLQERNRKLKRVSVLLSLALFVIYAFMIGNLFTRFDTNAFVEQVGEELLDLRPQGEAMVREVISTNRDEVLRRVDAAVQKNLPLVTEALDREVKQLADEASVMLYERVKGFVRNQLSVHGKAFFGQYPELEDAGYRTAVEDQIMDVMDRAVASVVDREFTGIEESIRGIEDVLNMPTVRAEVDAIRADPEHSARFTQAFLSLIAGPYAR